MKKLYTIVKNKTFTKPLFVLLTLFLGITIISVQSNKTGTAIKQNKKDNTTTIKKFIEKADILFDANKIDSSYFYYNKAQILCDPKINPEDYVYILSSMADIQTGYSNYIASEEILTKTLPYLKNVKTPRIVRNVYSYIAYNYCNTYDCDNAIIYHKKALKLPSTPFKKSLIVKDIALVYIQEKKYEKAVILLEILASKKAVYKREPNVSDRHHAFILNNLAFCYFNLGNPKALSLYLESLKKSIKAKDDYGIVYTYRNLSLFYEKSNLKLAHEYAEKSYKQACIIKSATNRVNSLAQLMKTSEGNELRKYSSEYIRIIDSITIGRRKAKNQFAQIKYDLKTDKAENLQLKTQKAENDLLIERQKSRTIISCVVLAISISILLYLFYYLSLKHKKETNYAIYESENRISKKLHDELAHDVYKTLSFAKNTDLEAAVNKEKFLKDLDVIYSKTRNISKENSKIKTDKHYPIALKEMVSGYKTPRINILINGFDTIRWNEIERNKKIILYRVLQEQFVNMKKHSQASLVSVSFNIKNKNLQIIYIDNGVGIKNSTLILKNGLQNVESRIKTINGTINFGNDSQKGFKISFTFPL